MVWVKLKDGRDANINIDPTWGDAEQQRAIQEWKTNNPAVADPSDTDSNSAYAGKMAGSVARGTGGGLASTIDMLGNTIGVVPRVAYNLYQGQPAFSGFGGSAVRDAYEGAVPAQPQGSDYETTANVASVVGPGVVETALMPEVTAGKMVMGGVDAGLGYLGGKFGRQGGEELGREYFGDTGAKVGGAIGELLGGAVAPVAATRTGARTVGTAAGHAVGGPIGAVIGGGGSFGGPILRKMGFNPGRLDPYSMIPPTSMQRFSTARAPVGGLSAVTTGGDTSEADAAAQQQEMQRYKNALGIK